MVTIQSERVNDATKLQNVAKNEKVWKERKKRHGNVKGRPREKHNQERRRVRSRPPNRGRTLHLALAATPKSTP